MYLIAGLGNPGLKYRKTPHNAGFMAVDALAHQHKLRFVKSKFDAQEAELRLGGEKVLILKPQTYMNLSGKSIAAAAKYYNIPSENIIVIYDDKDLALGKLRIRAKGSSGSHNGMKSIIECLGTENFARVRFGIGKPPEGMRLMDYVLHKIDRQEKAAYEQAAEDSAMAAQEIIVNGLESAQQKYSSK